MANLGYLQLTRDCVQACRFCSNPPTGEDLTETQMRAAIDEGQIPRRLDQGPGIAERTVPYRIETRWGVDISVAVEHQCAPVPDMRVPHALDETFRAFGRYTPEKF